MRSVFLPIAAFALLSGCAEASDQVSAETSAQAPEASDTVVMTLPDNLDGVWEANKMKGVIMKIEGDMAANFMDEMDLGTASIMRVESCGNLTDGILLEMTDESMGTGAKRCYRVEELTDDRLVLFLPSRDMTTEFTRQN